MLFGYSGLSHQGLLTPDEMGEVRWLVTICCRGFVVRLLTSEFIVPALHLEKNSEIRL